jgi:hypothetical protein
MTNLTKHLLPIRRRGDQRGAAMVLVMVFLLLALMSLTYCFDNTRQLFAFEEQALRIGASEDGIERALGIGIARLRSGVPADSSYSCRVKLRDSGGSDVETYDIIYTQVALDRWTVEAVPSSIELEDCPGLFSASCPVAP